MYWILAIEFAFLNYLSDELIIFFWEGGRAQLDVFNTPPLLEEQNPNDEKSRTPIGKSAFVLSAAEWIRCSCGII